MNNPPIPKRAQIIKGKNTPKRLRNRCDSLLTPIIALMFPKCFLCGVKTQVAHHFIHKSKSSALRYDLDNLIPLCHHCHLMLHHNESKWAGMIINQKGLEWFNDLQRRGNEIVKTTQQWYEVHLERLKKIYDGLI